MAAARIAAALDNILMLQRPQQEGLATVWDGNKYVQCRSMAEATLRCEAAGTLMQPSLERVLGPDKVKRLNDLGWTLDVSFGNYVQTFPSHTPVKTVADRLLQTLLEAYGANLAGLDVMTDWIAKEACPPRNGPRQNLAGLINDAPTMAKTALHGCAFTPPSDFEAHPAVLPTETLVAVYGPRVAGELQRLRVNLDRSIYFAVESETGYVQCAPETAPRAFYCEAASAESWSLLSSVLTPDRVAHLHAAGFSDPGRSPNYSKVYPLDSADEAAIAHELITLLHDVYGYTGSPKLTFATEKGH